MSKQGIFDKLLAQTEIRTGVGRKDILGCSRLKNIVAVRKIFWVALRMEGFTLTAIGNRVGREHSTVARETRFASDDLKDNAAACCLLCDVVPMTFRGILCGERRQYEFHKQIIRRVPDYKNNCARWIEVW